LVRRKNPTRRSRPNKQRRRFRWGRAILLVLLLGAFGIGVVLGVYGWRASRFDMKAVEQMKERSTVYDMDGRIWGRLQGENRVPVTLAEVSPFFIGALLAREDTRFFEHSGVDPKGIARALVRTVQGQQQGGSTLTQQLARNSFDSLGPRKSLDRKLLEVFVARRIEASHSKEEILAHYMNRIYFGSGVYGIEMASRVYFGKPAKDLSLSEAAMIAGIIRAPTRASPLSNPTRARNERDMVLDRLLTDDCAAMRLKYGISPELIEVARKQPLKTATRRAASTQENYAMDMIMREMDLFLEDEQQDEGGLRIYTTIDPVLQDEAQRALDRALAKVEQRSGYPHPRKSDFTEEMRKAELPTQYLQGAVVVVDNSSGGIRALVGGRDYRESKFNRAIEARRTIGSTFKPFVYAAAFGKGLSPWSAISDGPIQPGEIEGAQGWRPENSDERFTGIRSAEEGLVFSRNTMTVRVGAYAGIGSVGKLAAQVGLGEMPENPQSYIGNFGATPKDVTLAYTALANGGIKRQGYLIERIDNANGEVIYRAAHGSFRALDADSARTTSSALVKVFERGTAAGAKALGWSKPAAGKTGTTDNYHDAWFIGYTASLTCGVWVGLDTPAMIVPRGYGAALALPVWVDVMKRAPENKYPSGSLGDDQGADRQKPRSEIAGGAGEPDDHEGGLRKGEANQKGGVLRSFRRFFGGQ
jgi:penicillin-binding protein 1A